MQHRTLLTLASLLALIALSACAPADDNAGAAPSAAPQQPADEDLSGKADGITKDAVKTDADESLKSTRLRRALCDAALDAPNTFRSQVEADAFDASCTRHAFTVTAFWSHARLTEDGAPALIAMDVRIDAADPQGYTLQTRLTRLVDASTLALTWQAHLLDVQRDAPDAQTETSLDGVVAAIQRAGGSLAGSTVAHQFAPVDEGQVPSQITDTVYEEIDNRVSDQLGVVLDAEGWYMIQAGGDTLGWAALLHERHNPNDEGDDEDPDPSTLEEVGFDLYILTPDADIIDVLDWKP